MNPSFAKSIVGISGCLDQSKTAAQSERRRSALEEELDNLESALSANDAVIVGLADKLDPILLPLIPANTQAGKESPPPMQSQAVAYVRQMRERLQRQTEAIADLIQRQQVR